jgi:hypothetical protein
MTTTLPKEELNVPAMPTPAPAPAPAPQVIAPIVEAGAGEAKTLAPERVSFPPLAEALQKDNNLAKEGVVPVSESRRSLFRQARTMSSILVAAIGLCIGMSVDKLDTGVLTPLGEKIGNTLAPAYESLMIPSTGLAAFEDRYPQDNCKEAWEALDSLGPANAVNKAMETILENPGRLRDKGLKNIALEALDARQSPEAAETFLLAHKLPAPTDFKSKKGEPVSIPERWRPAYDNLVGQMTPAGVIDEEALQQFHQETELADGVIFQTRKILSTLNIEGSSKEGQEILSNMMGEALETWAENRGSEESRETAVRLLANHLSGIEPRWTKAEPKVQANPETGMGVLGDQGLKPTNIGKPSGDVIVIGENHDLAKAKDYEGLINALDKKGFKALSLEIPTDGSYESQELNKLREKAKSKGWEIQQNDVPVEQWKKMGEKERTLARWGLEAGERGRDGKPFFEALSETGSKHLRTRSDYIAANLLGQKGVLHIGGAAHTTEIQEEMARFSGKRPLGIEIDYNDPTMEAALQQTGRAASLSANSLKIPQGKLAAEIVPALPQPTAKAKPKIDPSLTQGPTI